MSVSLTEDIKSVSELKKKTNEILKQMRRTGRPIIFTVNGKPDAVLIDAEVFEKKLKAFNLGVLLADAENDIKRGRVRQAREFLKEFKKPCKSIALKLPKLLNLIFKKYLNIFRQIILQPQADGFSKCLKNKVMRSQSQNEFSKFTGFNISEGTLRVGMLNGKKKNESYF